MGAAPDAGTERVAMTPAAAELLAKMTEIHGPLMCEPPARPARPVVNASSILLRPLSASAAPITENTVRCCVDWTEQRHHISGPLGRALLEGLTTSGWVRPAAHSRVLGQ